MLRFLLLFGFLPLSLMAQNLDVQGHRGCRGLQPENTLVAFRKAMELGVTTLELDVVISGDGQVVVSHDPWMNAEICGGGAGLSVPEGKTLNLYRMTYAQIAQYDCGSRGNLRFPDQALVPAAKPLLTDVLTLIEQEAKALGRPPLRYNIELKSQAATDGLYHPAPLEFCRRVHEALAPYGLADRLTIQSFDFRILQRWYELYPETALAALVTRPISTKRLQRKLGFTPAIYSPYFRSLNARRVSQFQAEGIQVIPWTVNSVTDMERLRRWGVDGIITDYPDRLLTLVAK